MVRLANKVAGGQHDFWSEVNDINMYGSTRGMFDKEGRVEVPVKDFLRVMEEAEGLVTKVEGVKQTVEGVSMGGSEGRG